jgi:hypothetical protein
VLTLNALRRQDFKTQSELSGNVIHSCMWNNTWGISRTQSRRVEYDQQIKSEDAGLCI